MSPTRRSADEVAELIRAVQAMHALRANNQLGVLPPLPGAASVLGLDPVYLARDVAHALDTYVRVDVHRSDGTVRQRWIDPNGEVHGFDPSRYWFDGDERQLHVGHGLGDRVFTAHLTYENGLLSRFYRDEALAFGLTNPELGRIYLSAMARQETFEQAVAKEITARRAELDAMHPRLSDLVRRVFDVRRFWQGEVAWHQARMRERAPAYQAHPEDQERLDEARQLFAGLREFARPDATGPDDADVRSINDRLNEMMELRDLAQMTRLSRAQRSWPESTERSVQQLERDLLDAGAGTVSLVTLYRGRGFVMAVVEGGEVHWYDDPSGGRPGQRVDRPTHIASSLDLAGDGSVLTRARDGSVRLAAELPELNLDTHFLRDFRARVAGVVPRPRVPRARPGPSFFQGGLRPYSPDDRFTHSEDDFRAPSDPWAPRRISRREPGALLQTRQLPAVVRPPAPRHDLSLTETYLRVDEEGQADLRPYDRDDFVQMRTEPVADYAAILWQEMGGPNREVTISDIVGRGWPYALDFFLTPDRFQGLPARAFQALDRSPTHTPRMAFELPDELAVDTRIWFSARGTTGSAVVLPGGRSLVYVVGEGVRETTLRDLRDRLNGSPELVIAEPVVPEVVFPLHAVPDELPLDQAYVYRNRETLELGVGVGGLTGHGWADHGPLAEYALIFRLTGFAPGDSVSNVTVAEVVSDIGGALRFLSLDRRVPLIRRAYQFLREHPARAVELVEDAQDFPENLPYGTWLLVSSGGYSGAAVVLADGNLNIYAPDINLTGILQQRHVDRVTQRPFTYVIARPQEPARLSPLPGHGGRFDEVESPTGSESETEFDPLDTHVMTDEPMPADPHLYRRGRQRRISEPNLDEQGWRIDGSFREFAPISWVTQGGSRDGTTAIDVVDADMWGAVLYFELARQSARAEDTVRAYFESEDPERIIYETRSLPLGLPPETWVWFTGSQRTGAVYVRPDGRYRYLVPGGGVTFLARDRGVNPLGPGPHTFVIARPAASDQATQADQPSSADRRVSLALEPARVYRVPEEVPVGLRISQAHLYENLNDGGHGVGRGGQHAENWRDMGAMGTYALVYWLLNLTHGYEPEPEVTVDQIVTTPTAVGAGDGFGFGLSFAVEFARMDPRLSEASRVTQYLNDHSVRFVWQTNRLPEGLPRNTLIWGSGGGLNLAAIALGGGYFHTYTLGEPNTAVLPETRLRDMTRQASSFAFVVAVLPEDAEEYFGFGPAEEIPAPLPESRQISDGAGGRAISDVPFSPPGTDEARSQGAPSPSSEPREVSESEDDVVSDTPSRPPGLGETTSHETASSSAAPWPAPGTVRESTARRLDQSELSGENASDHAELDELLTLYGMREVDVAGDGNCFYHSLFVVAGPYLAQYLGLDPEASVSEKVRALRQFLVDRVNADLALAESDEELWTRYAEHFVPEDVVSSGEVSLPQLRALLTDHLLDMGDYHHRVAEQVTALAARELGLPLTLIQYGQPNIDFGPPGGERIYFIRDGEHFRGIEAIEGGVPWISWGDLQPADVSTVEEARDRRLRELAAVAADFERDVRALGDVWRDMPGGTTTQAVIDPQTVEEAARTQLGLALTDEYAEHPSYLRTHWRIGTIQGVAGTVRVATQRLLQLSTFLWLTHGRPHEAAISDIEVDAGLAPALASLRTVLESPGADDLDHDRVPDWVATTLQTWAGRNAQVTRTLPANLPAGTYVWFSGLGITGAGVVQQDESVERIYRVADPGRSIEELLGRRLTYVIAEPGEQEASTSRAGVSDLDAFREAQDDLPEDGDAGARDAGDSEPGDPDTGGRDDEGRQADDHPLPEDIDSANSRLMDAVSAFWDTAMDIDAADRQAFEAAYNRASTLLDQVQSLAFTPRRRPWIEEMRRTIAAIEELTRTRQSRQTESGSTRDEDPQAAPPAVGTTGIADRPRGGAVGFEDVAEDPSEGSDSEQGSPQGSGRSGPSTGGSVSGAERIRGGYDSDLAQGIYDALMGTTDEPAATGTPDEEGWVKSSHSVSEYCVEVATVEDDVRPG